MPDPRVALVRWAAQFRHQRGRGKRAVAHLLADIKVCETQARAAEVKLAPARDLVLEVCRAIVIGSRIHCCAKVHCWLPVEIIMRVIALGDEEVYSA